MRDIKPLPLGGGRERGPYYIAIDLGGTVIKLAIVSGGTVVEAAQMEADSLRGLAPRLAPLAEAVNRLLGRHGIGHNKLGGMVVAFPGIVNVGEARAIATNAKYDDAPTLDLREWARRNWGIPLAMDNDARMATVGEWRHGAGRGADNMVMMTIGTGIGTGAVVDGRLLYGQNFCAGSLGGHLIVDYRGRRCTCGNVGCAEAHGSSFFLPEIIRGNEKVSDAFKQGAEAETFKQLCEKMRSGDPEATAVLQECMDVWSAAIVNYIHAYDPQLVVVGGGIMKSADLILPHLRQRVNKLAWRPWGEIQIVPSQLGDQAALLAADYYFTSHKTKEQCI